METTPTLSACSVDGCVKAKFCRGLCSMHYSRQIRHGDVNKTLRQPPQVNVTEKRCPRCANTKPIENFGRRSNGKPEGYCHDCKNAYDASYATTDQGREARRSARATWNESNYGYFLNYRYGITEDDYMAMVRKQGDRCAVCGTTDPGCGNNRWAVDHCHDSLTVRGLLCMNCNTGLGYYRDDPELLRAAADYLEQT